MGASQGGSSKGEQLSTNAISTDYFNYARSREIKFIFQELLSFSPLFV